MIVNGEAGLNLWMVIVWYQYGDNMSSQLIYFIRTDIFKRMQPVQKYNILIIGRSGSGKSATTKLLTSNPAIKVANSLKEVTTEVNYYDGTSFQVMGEFIQFHIIDIPGLDKINNRFLIREKLLNKLQEHNVSLNAIIYVSSLTERDTLDQNKLFEFLQQLPWGPQHKKQALIPILTKYDNLIIDSQEQDIQSTKKQYQLIFEKMNYQQAWSKRIYWINETKSLQFKIKSYQQIRQKYEKQVQRLVEMMKKNKVLLTAKAIRQLMDQQVKFILKKLFVLQEINKVSFKKEEKSHTLLLTIQVQPKNMEENFTMFSASSIGIFISRVCQKQISSYLSVMLISIPIALTLLKLVNESFTFHDKQIGQDTSNQTIIHSYQKICEEINSEMERQWKQLNNNLEFKVFKKQCCCNIAYRNYKFFDISNISLSYEGTHFQRSKQENGYQFKMKIPKFQQETLWTPQIMVKYELKKYSQEELMKKIELIRKQFCSKI